MRVCFFLAKCAVLAFTSECSAGAVRTGADQMDKTIEKLLVRFNGASMPIVLFLRLEKVKWMKHIIQERSGRHKKKSGV